MPQESFLITADASDGIEGQDMSSASCWDISTWEQVAHWHGYCDPSEFGYILRDIGAYYNWAMVAVETNYPGNATYAKLKELKYPKLWANNEDGDPWCTTAKTRPLAITALREAMRESTMKINSTDTISELRTFVRRNNGKLEAEQGSHDDCVMDAAIAAYILKNSAYVPEELQSIRRQPLREILHKTNHNYRPGRSPGIV
jgi:hypothetical protein